MNQETKVGLFVLVALAVIMASAVMLGGVNIFSRHKKFYSEFDDVQALPPKATVKISGVEVGKVLKVELVNNRARVTLGVDPEISIYEDAVARIGSSGIIGTRFVEIIPGSADKKLLEPGSVIEGLGGSGLGAMVEQLSAVFQPDEEFGDPIKNVKALLYNLRTVSDSFREAMGDRPQDIKTIVANIKALTESTKIFTQDLADITQSRKEDVKSALAKFKSITDRLDAILAKVESGDGTIGTLVNDEQTATNVKEAVASIKETAKSAKNFLGRFSEIRTFWNYRYRYDARDDEGKSDIGVKIVPREGKFYAVGVSHVGEPITDEKRLEFERKNRITGVMGADWGPFTGYAGAIRSDGGAGLDFRPLWWNKDWGKRVTLTAEASDFERDRTVKGQRLEGPVVSVGGHIAITPWLLVGARGEDIMERGAFMSYTNIVFEDKDLAYLLGFVGLAR